MHYEPRIFQKKSIDNPNSNSNLFNPSTKGTNILNSLINNHKKKIDFKKEVLNKIKEKETQDVQNYTVMMKYWLSCLLELKNMALIRFQFCINDSADVTVRIRPKADSYRQIIEHLDILSLENNELTMDEEDIKRAFKEQLSFFYYQ